MISHQAELALPVEVEKGHVSNPHEGLSVCEGAFTFPDINLLLDQLPFEIPVPAFHNVIAFINKTSQTIEDLEMI